MGLKLACRVGAVICLQARGLALGLVVDPARTCIDGCTSVFTDVSAEACELVWCQGWVYECVHRCECASV